MSRLSTGQAVDRIRDLPSLPAVVVELLETLQAQDVSVDVLSEKLSRDQALAAKTLRLANSSFYGLQCRAATIRDAITVLGLRAVRMLVTAGVVTDQFSRPLGSAFDFEGFWQHCIGTALAARSLATRIGVSDDMAFTAGLLHDIGRLVLVTRFPADYGETIDQRRANDMFMVDAERAVLGIDHAQVGQALARHWNFPPTILDAIAGHHAPDDGGGELSLAAIVHVADAIAHALDFSGTEDDLVPPLSAAVWSRLGLDRGECMGVLRETEAQFDSVSQILVARPERTQ